MEERTPHDGAGGTAQSRPVQDRPVQDRPAQDRPAGELAKQLQERVTRLVRDELRLAQLEMTEKGKRAGLGAGMFGGGGVIALYGTGAIIAGVIVLISLALPAWAAAFIIGGALLAVAGVLALLGGKQIRQATPPVPQHAVDSTKADIEEIRERAHR